jgi:hypothetical protein
MISSRVRLQANRKPLLVLATVSFHCHALFVVIQDCDLVHALRDGSALVVVTVSVST